MGNQCQNMCEDVSNARKFSLEGEDQDKGNRQLSINLKAFGAVPIHYFGTQNEEPIGKLPKTSIILCEDNVYILKFASGVAYHGEI